MLQNERVSIYYGTKQAYEVEKQNKRINENALYFIEGVLYSGYELYTQEYHKVTSYPSIGQKNCIYINTLDSSVAIWDDDTSEWLYLSKSTVGVDEAINELKAEIEELSKITAEEIKTNQSELESHAKNNVVHITNDERELWNDKYTKVEIDNKFSAFETDIDWKEAVNTYDDIVTTYPNPKDGWTVNVKDTDYTYRYNGTEWVTISANATPKATNEVDGLLSKEDHTKYEETYNQKHTHSNKSILDNTTASYTTAEQTKLDGIATGAEVNQNAFSNVIVGSTTIAADSKTDSLTLAGSNVTLTPDATNDKVTIGITKANVTTALGYTPPTTNTTYGVATSSTLGLVKSGTDITVDSSGNVSVKNNSHEHTVSNISDLTATASELNVLDGITASTAELNYTDGVTSNIQIQLDAKAPLASPTLTGTPKAPTASAGTNSTQIATTAFVTTAVANGIAASDAMIIKGTIGTSGTVTSLPTTYKTGWTYRVVTAGTYAGQVCEIGDLIVALVDRSGSGNVDSDWCVAQTNINGAITGIKSGDAYISTSQSGSVVTITHKDVTRTNTTSTASPSHGGTFTAVKTVTSDAKGHVTGVDTETVTLPSAYTHPSYTARTGVPTANQTPAFGGTFSVSQPVSDATGHITAMNSRTITIPSAVATTSSAGLESAADKTKLDATNIAYGTCSTAAATAAKVITISGNTNWALTAGSRITVKFTNTNTASNPTFNVNGTGAKSVWYNTALITTSNLAYAGTANRPMDFVYDGTQYIFVGWSIDSNTTYSNATLGQGYGTCATAEATTAKVVTLSSYSLVTGGIVAVKFTYAVPASATMNINSKGAKNIYYRGSAITAGVIKAGDIGVFIYDGTQYHLLTVDRNSNTTYTLSSFGITATATELNYVDGVTSNIQTQLDGKAPSSHTHSSYVNQNAFSNVTVGSTTISADTITDTLTLAAGSNVTITPDATNDKITISSTNTTYSNATTSTAGLMSASDKTKLDGIASGANKTTLATNLTTSTVGYALDATMGKDLYSYVRMLQTDVVYLKYLTNALTEDFVEAKYIKNHSHSELGSVNVAYMPYEKMTTLTTSNKVIVGFTNGAVGIFSVDVASRNTLGRTITWIRGSVPYVSKTTIQSGTNTLALASGSGAYTTYDREIYVSTGETKQTLVFEFSATSSNISVFYKIINTNDGFNSLSETETDALM